MMLDKSVKDFLGDIEAATPIPGGGSVSSLAGAFGAALVRMYQNLSFGRKNYENRSEEEKNKFQAVFAQLENIQNELLDAVEKDALAYQGVIAAYQLPKDDEAALNRRNNAIYEATLVAIESPLSIMRNTVTAMRLLAGIAETGNKNAVSDIGVGVILLAAATEGAALNVKINLTVNNKDIHKAVLQECEALLLTAFDLKKTILEDVSRIMG